MISYTSSPIFNKHIFPALNYSFIYRSTLKPPNTKTELKDKYERIAIYQTRKTVLISFPNTEKRVEKNYEQRSSFRVSSVFDTAVSTKVVPQKR